MTVFSTVDMSVSVSVPASVSVSFGPDLEDDQTKPKMTQAVLRGLQQGILGPFLKI